MIDMTSYPSINHYPDMMVDKALSTPGARILVVGVRPNFIGAASWYKSMMADLLDALTPYKEQVKRVSRSTFGEIVLVNGASIMLRHEDAIDLMRGMSVDVVYLDEALSQKVAAIAAMRALINHGKVYRY